MMQPDIIQLQPYFLSGAIRYITLYYGHCLQALLQAVEKSKTIQQNLTLKGQRSWAGFSDFGTDKPFTYSEYRIVPNKPT